MHAIPVHTPEIAEPDRRAVLRALEAGWLSSAGPQVRDFEERFARALGREHAVAVGSGTAGLDIAVRALGLGPGDEVLVPSLTIISCAQAIVESGATPVPVDCDPSDWNAHLRHFEQRLTPRTRAVMLVHLYGLCADLDPLLGWARDAGLMVIEDASQAQGARYRDRPCGAFGDLSVFSLYANKLVTTGEGGMILCDADPLAERCRSLRNLCFDPRRRFWHEDLGWSCRMTAMQAALGASQLDRLSELARRQRAIGEAYRQALEDLAVFELAPSTTATTRNGYWVFGLVLAPQASFSREALMASLADEGIETRTFFYGLHQQPALLTRHLVAPVSLPITEALAARGLYLPGGLGLRREDQDRVVEAVIRFVGAHS